MVAAVDVSTGTGVSRARKLAAGACAADAAEASIAALAVTAPSVRTIDGMAAILRWPRRLVKGEGRESERGHLPGGNPGKMAPTVGYLP
jgi:hypothetical protein